MANDTRKIIEMLDDGADKCNAEIQWQIEDIEDELKNLKIHPTAANATALANAATKLGRLLHTAHKIELMLNNIRLEADKEK